MSVHLVLLFVQEASATTSGFDLVAFPASNPDSVDLVLAAFAGHDFEHVVVNEAVRFFMVGSVD